MERIGSARVVLLGEATHGTSEFYRMRERITRDLIIKKGFRFIAVEADWPDAARVDHYVRHFQYPPSEWTAFARFPTWMWRNTEVRDFVSAHNSHIGNAEATEMATRGEYNLGQLCRREFGDQAYLVGFGTHSGTVAAASEWDGPMEVKNVQPARSDSYERLCHATGLAHFMLGLRGRCDLCGPAGLGKQRLERAIGVIYRPENELASHYFRASLPAQFDEYIWFDSTRAVTPLETAEIKGLPDTYPFGV